MVYVKYYYLLVFNKTLWDTEYMRWLLIILACNQVMYDQIYKEICMNATKYDSHDKKAELAAMADKHRLIDALRKLCRGQKSSYERGE